MIRKYEIVNATDQDASIWDNFVRTHLGSVYQLFGWRKIFQESYNYRSNYQLLYKNRQLVGIAPAVFRGKIARKLVSLPFVDCSGPMAASDEIALDYISSLKKSGINFEIYSPNLYKQNLAQSVYENYVLKIGDYQTMYENNYHHKTRNIVRKSQKVGFTGEISQGSQKLVLDFYELQIQTMKKLGTLSLSLSLFQNVYSEFRKCSYFSISRLDGNISSLLWLFSFNKSLYVWSNASDERSLSLGSNYFVYDQAIKFACREKMQQIVLGASMPGSSQAFFKSRWGAKSSPIYLYAKGAADATSRWHLLHMLRPFIRHIPQPIYSPLSDLAFSLL